MTISVKQLIADLRQQAANIDTELEKALQHREWIASTPIPKGEVLANLFLAIDGSAANFVKDLNSVVTGCARRRNGTGISKYPEIIREVGNYSALNTDAINFFFGDELKAKLKKFIAGMDYPGGADGLSEADYKRQLADADAEVDRIKQQRDELIQELDFTGKN